MKKTFRVFAIAALSLSMIFASCSQTPSNIDVVTVDASDISVKVWPGKNVITWTPVDNAEYILTKNGKAMTIVQDAYSVEDPAIEDGQEYKYVIYTAPKGLVVKSEFADEDLTVIGANKTAYYVKGNKSSATVKAVKPSLLKDGNPITAIDLADFEPNGNGDYKVSAENIAFFAMDGKLYIEFPTKPYLTYKYEYFKGNKNIVLGIDPNRDVTVNPDSDARFSNNGTTVMQSGVYTAQVKVSAAGYPDTIITVPETVTIETLDAPVATNNQIAVYKDEGKTARILWTPAVKSDKTEWAPANYTVYVADSKDNLTAINVVKEAVLDEEGNPSVDNDGNPIENEVIATLEGVQKGDKVYYVDYEIPNNKLEYTFYVVLKDGDKLEGNGKSATLAAFADIADVDVSAVKANAYYSKFDNQTVDNDAYLRIEGLTDKQSAVVSYKKISKFANDAYTPASALLDTEFEALPAVGNYTYMDFIVSDVKEDEKVVFLYEIKEEGKKSYYNVVVLGALDTTDSTSFAFVDYEDVRTKSTEAPKYNFTFTVNNKEDVDEWTYTYAYAKLDKNGGLATVWSQDYPISFAWDKTAGKFKYVAKNIILDATYPMPAVQDQTTGVDKIPGYYADYAIKLVKTSKVADVVEVGYEGPISVSKSVE